MERKGSKQTDKTTKKKRKSGCSKGMKTRGKCREEDDDDEEQDTLVCTETPTTNQHEVFVEYVGIPGRVTPMEIALLEQSFQDTYNGITNNTTSTCQGLSFRLVQTVDILTSPALPDNPNNNSTRRRTLLLQQEEEEEEGDDVRSLPPARPFIYKLLIRQECLGCRNNNTDSNNNRLFRTDDTIVGRNLQDGPSETATAAATTTNEENMMLQPRSRRYGGSTGKGSKTHAKKTRSKKQDDKATDDDADNPMDNEACPECLAPTVVDFTLAYDTAIQFLSSSSPTNAPALQNVHRVVSVSELEPVDCNETQTTFETDVFLNLVMDNDDKDEDEGASFSRRIAVLEQGFRETYNALNAFNPNTCDLLFRQVELAEIVNTDAAFNRRFLQSTTTNTTTNVTDNTTTTLPPTAAFLLSFVFHFRVRGRCRGCRRDANLFDQGIRRRRLLQEEEEEEWTHYSALIGNDLVSSSRFLQQQQTDHNSNNNTCACAVNANEFRAPTREEFTSALNDTVQLLALNDQIDFVDEVVETTEVEQVECPAASGFETDVFLDFFGNPDATTNFEELALESGFVSTYNSLTENYCDPLFRTVLDATIVEVVEEDGGLAGRLLQVTNDTNTTNTTNSTTGPPPRPNITDFRPFVIRFRVSGRCRGCRRDTSLFDEASRRRRLFGLESLGAVSISNEGGRRRRRLEGSSDACFCDVLPVALRAPTEEEFEREYNTTVVALALPSVAVVLDVDEPNPSASPTSGPTGTLTTSPSMRPTTSTPTIQPTTSSPSFQPSIRPTTSSPSFKPSIRPTTATPSIPPSPAPSTTPPSLQPTTLSPTAEPTTAAPSNNPTLVASTSPSIGVADEELFRLALEFPYQLSDNAFGDLADRTRLPLYLLDDISWSGTLGPFEGVRFSDDTPTTVTFISVIATWETILEFSNVSITETELFFIDDSNFRATLVMGTLAGPQESQDFIGIVATDLMDAVVIPFVDPVEISFVAELFSSGVTTTLPNERNLGQRSKPGQADVEVDEETKVFLQEKPRHRVAEFLEITNWMASSSIGRERRLQTTNSTCDSFLTEAVDSTACNETEVLITDQVCTSNVLQLYEEESAGILAAISDFESLVSETVLRWLESRAAEMAIGYVGCLLDPMMPLDTCMAEVHALASLTSVNARVQFVSELDSTRIVLEESLDSQFMDLCSRVRSTAAGCFSCLQCSAGLQPPAVECCQNQDCVDQMTGNTCVSNVCLNSGNPRFTLTWTGEDDLDLHVVTPDGFEIFWANVTDPDTGGSLDRDAVPLGFGSYVESVFFPEGTAPDGLYSYFVTSFTPIANSDTWLLRVFVNGENTVNQTGLGSSETFTIDVTTTP